MKMKSNILRLGVFSIALALPGIVFAQRPSLANLQAQINNLPPTWSHNLPPETRFVLLPDFNDEAVLDRNTGLVWEQGDNNFSLTTEDYPGAQYHCMYAVVGGQQGWRLPDVAELTSLFNPTTGLIDEPNPFSSRLSIQRWLWTSTPYPWDPINFNMGYLVNAPYPPNLGGNPHTGSSTTFCVRGGKN